MGELAKSIQTHGLLQPIVVRPIGKDRYEIVAGERRYRAYRMLDRRAIPAVVVEMDEREAQMASILENLQRDDLNPLEETEGILRVLAMRLNVSEQQVVRLFHDAAAERRGRRADNVIRNEAWAIIEKTFQELGRMTPESFRVNRLPLLKLPSEVLEALRAGKIDYTKARAIGRVKDEKARKELLERAIEERWSLALIRAEVRELLQPERTPESELELKAKRILKRVRWSSLPPSKQREVLDLLQRIDSIVSSIEKL